MAIPVCNVLLFQARVAYDPNTCTESQEPVNQHDQELDYSVFENKAIVAVYSVHDSHYE